MGSGGNPAQQHAGLQADGTFLRKSTICSSLRDGKQPERKHLPRSVFIFSAYNSSSPLINRQLLIKLINQ